MERAGSPRLLLYGRPGCHLCHDLLEIAAPIAKRLSLGLAEVDVSGHDDLEARYGADVPVLVLDRGEEIVEIARHRASDRELASRLSKACKEIPSS
ncbi:MAG: glutaredoxin family protein [Acidobacteriota bacterium]